MSDEIKVEEKKPKKGGDIKKWRNRTLAVINGLSNEALKQELSNRVLSHK